MTGATTTSKPTTTTPAPKDQGDNTPGRGQGGTQGGNNGNGAGNTGNNGKPNYVTLMLDIFSNYGSRFYEIFLGFGNFFMC